ncbi:hypothetical protein ILYODFUR_022139 [Ilyodon furcidens]|uniref:Uncharacterized protein n=1 Tax=Ilyodon furcidens TaxID=33524 RepID=A0ABV0TLS8_9TELE
MTGHAPHKQYARLHFCHEMPPVRTEMASINQWEEKWETRKPHGERSEPRAFLLWSNSSYHHSAVAQPH